jgi:hypothetical protein
VREVADTFDGKTAFADIGAVGLAAVDFVIVNPPLIFARTPSMPLISLDPPGPGFGLNAHHVICIVFSDCFEIVMVATQVYKIVRQFLNRHACSILPDGEGAKAA